MKVKPILDRVLVKPRKVPEKSKGGIFLPDIARQERSDMGMILDIGLVIAAGPGGYSTETGCHIPMTVKAGDEVIYLKFTANDIDIDGEPHKLVAQRDVLGVVGKE